MLTFLRLLAYGETALQWASYHIHAIKLHVILRSFIMLTLTILCLWVNYMYDFGKSLTSL